MKCTWRPLMPLFTRMCFPFQSVCAASGHFTRSSTQFTGGACEFSTWGACLPSPPEAFLGDPPLSGCEPFSPFWGPPFLRRSFPYLDALPRVLKKECLRSKFPCQVLLRDSSCLRAPGIRIASACTRGVIRVPLTVELQLEAQTLPFLPISGP